MRVRVLLNDKDYLTSSLIWQVRLRRIYLLILVLMG